jgi:hypothetical protein
MSKLQTKQVPSHVWVGDKALWSGVHGTDQLIPVTITSMDVTDEPDERYGESKTSVPLDLVHQDKVVFTLDNGHWCYSEQLFFDADSIREYIGRVGGITKGEAATLHRIRSYDPSLPQIWVDNARILTEDNFVAQHFVWSYDKEPTFGEPFPLTLRGVEIMKSLTLREEVSA